MLKYLGSILIAILVGGLIIGAIELAGMLVFPLPGGMTGEQFAALSWEEKQTILHNASPVVFLPVLVGYLVGMLAAGALLERLWPRVSGGAVVAVAIFFALVNILNVLAMPQPLWVSMASFVILLLSPLAGQWLAQRRGRPPEVKEGG